MLENVLFRLAVAITCLLAVLASLLSWNNSSHIQARNGGLIYSSAMMVTDLWQYFRFNHIEQASGRTIINQKTKSSTAAGESMTMLRAVWIDDKSVFDASWHWTQTHLQTKSPLLESSYGLLVNKTYGITDSTNDPLASTDAAYALLLADGRWNDANYADEARNILQAVWQNHVINTPNGPILVNDTSGNFNVAGFSPYAYDAFAKLDTGHNWAGLRHVGYYYLNKALQSNDLLPALLPTNSSTVTNNTANYGASAQLAWRLSLDKTISGDIRADQTILALSGLDSVSFPRDQDVIGKVARAQIKGQYSADVAYGAYIAAKYDQDLQQWSKPMSATEDAWLWLSMTQYLQRLPNTVRL